MEPGRQSRSRISSSAGSSAPTATWAAVIRTGVFPTWRCVGCRTKASALGLALDPVQWARKNYLGDWTDSYAKFLDGLYAKRNPRHYRPIGATKFGNEIVDASVQQRRKEERDYEPQNNGLAEAELICGWARAGSCCELPQRSAHSRRWECDARLESTSMTTPLDILVTGGTGYIGQHLIPLLIGARPSGARVGARTIDEPRAQRRDSGDRAMR